MPARKPTKLKQIKGTLRKGRQKANEVTPEVAFPEPPAWLAGPALDEWKRIADEVEDLGYVSRLDRGVLTLYCVLWARIAEAGQGNGGPLKAAEVAQFRACSSSLGFDPASRGRISTPSTPAKDNGWESAGF